MAHSLTIDDLLSGAAVTHKVTIPAAVLRPSPRTDGDVANSEDGKAASAGEVVLRPLTVRDVQRITRAAREQHALTSVLMVQQALVSPKATVEQVAAMSAGLVQFLLERVNAISGLDLNEDDLDRAIKAPLARACFVLAREFGWTPADCSQLTIGQVLLYLEMLARDDRDDAADRNGAPADAAPVASEGGEA
jgi:hypothetical protein